MYTYVNIKINDNKIKNIKYQYISNNNIIIYIYKHIYLPCYIIVHGKILIKESKILLDTVLKIILLNYQNNFV